MLEFNLSRRWKPIVLSFAIFLLACSPKYDWREVRGTAEPFLVTLPAKPASYARPVNLDGQQVTMTMTAAEVDGVTFAVGTAQMQDAAQAQKSLSAMKTALVRNIGGTIRHENTQPAGEVSKQIEIEAVGAPGDAEPRLLLARFIAREKRIYQVVVTGAEKRLPREAADIFFSSFKPG